MKYRITALLLSLGCAWIVWTNAVTQVAGNPQGSKKWTVAGTAQTLDECQASKRLTHQQEVQKMREASIKHIDWGGSITFSGDGISGILTFECSPETMDARK